MAGRKLQVKFIVLILVIFCTFVGSASVWAAEEQKSAGTAEILDKQISMLDTSAITEFLSGLDEDTRRAIPEFDLRKLATTEGIKLLDPRKTISIAFRYLLKELFANARLMGELLTLSVLAALMQSLGSAFSSEGANELAYIICFMVLALITVKSFIFAISVASSAIGSMTTFITALLPLLFTMLVAAGGAASAAVMHPLMVMLSGGIGKIVMGLVFPLLFLHGTLGIISNISGRMQLTKLAAMVKDGAVVTLGACMTFFIGTVSVKGLAGPGLDAVTIRTSKFLAKAFLPVVGGLFSDAWDAVAGCSLVLKNAIGIFGLISIASVCLFPILKIACLILVYRITAAITQPIGDGRIVTMLNDIGTSLLVLMAAVACVGFMFFISLTVIVAIGGITVSAR